MTAHTSIERTPAVTRDLNRLANALGLLERTHVRWTAQELINLRGEIMARWQQRVAAACALSKTDLLHIVQEIMADKEKLEALDVRYRSITGSSAINSCGLQHLVAEALKEEQKTKVEILEVPVGEKPEPTIKQFLAGLSYEEKLDVLRDLQVDVYLGLQVFMEDVDKAKRELLAAQREQAEQAKVTVSVTVNTAIKKAEKIGIVTNHANTQLAELESRCNGKVELVLLTFAGSGGATISGKLSKIYIDACAPRPLKIIVKKEANRLRIPYEVLSTFGLIRTTIAHEFGSFH